MKNRFDEKILDEALQWLDHYPTIALATVIKTWGSSPRPVGSLMIVNQKADFSGSVSGGCVEGEVVRQCIDLLNSKELFKKIDFKVSNEKAWNVGLACGGEISVFIEKIN
jgi:xanthine/CO dehydrogenase XdhC/CoxF family maturation factor